MSKRDYIGFSGEFGKDYLRLIFYNNHYFLGRTYKNRGKDDERDKIGLNWKFNMEGRIDRLVCFFYKRVDQKDNIKNLFLIDKQPDKPNWNYHWGRFNPLPLEISYFGGNLDVLEICERFQKLIRTGHDSVREFFINRKEGKIKSFRKVYEGRKGLEEIFDDKPALEMLIKTAEITPTFELVEHDKELGEGILNIDYKQETQFNPFAYDF